MMDWTAIFFDFLKILAGSVSALIVSGLMTKRKYEAEVDRLKAEVETARAQAAKAPEMSSAQLADLFSVTAGRLVEASNSQYNELQEQFAEMKKENAAFRCEIARLEGKVDWLEGEITKKNIEAEAMSEKIRKLERELREKNREIEALEGENASLRERVAKLEQRLKELVDQK
jgi:predicted RNase H-like nuclease (RuvC/YqgF family)